MRELSNALLDASTFLWSVEAWMLDNFMIMWFACAWLFWTTMGIYLLKTKPVVRKACKDAMKAMWN